jgi:hypothetical protein
MCNSIKTICVSALLSSVLLGADQVAWSSLGALKGDQGNYTPVVITGPNTISVFVNTKDWNTNGVGTWYCRTGSWKGVGNPSVVISPTQITDLPNAFIRTTAVQRGPSGKWYAVLHVGGGYPSSNGFRPAWATSNDGVHWTYRGMFTVNGIFAPYVLGSSATLIVQEDKPSTPDGDNPANNRYLMWEDAYCFNRQTGGSGSNCPQLTMLYSADGRNWWTYNDMRGAVANVWPSTLPKTDGAQFASAVKTPFGYHIIAADTYPSNYLRHIFSCDGVHWGVLETASAPFVYAEGKGTNLAYDSVTGLVHAVTSGYHWSYREHAFTCASQ